MDVVTFGLTKNSLWSYKIKKSFIKNPEGTKNCYISASESNAYTMNLLQLIMSNSHSFFVKEGCPSRRSVAHW